MDINQVMQAHGVLGGGGSSGVKKIYSLVMQAEEPLNPKQGDMWVNPIKPVTKTTVSLNTPSVPIDGELLLQFEHIVYEMDFEKISSKIEGNANTNIYIFNINDLTQESMNNNFIALFQKDVVKEYGILKSIYQYNAVTDLWEVPESYYFNGAYWVDMSYRLYTQYSTSDLERRLPETLALSDTLINMPINIFQINADGSYYGKAMSGNNLVVTKYDRNGEVISSITFTTVNATYPCNIDYIDDFGNYYVVYRTMPVSVLTIGGRYIIKFSPDGTVLWTIDFDSTHTANIYLGCGNGYMIYRRYDGSNSAMPLAIISLNTGVFSLTASFRGPSVDCVFKSDGIYVADGYNTTPGFYKFSYSGATVFSSSVSNTSIFTGWGAQSRTFLYVDEELPNTYILAYSYNSAGYASYIVKFTADFSVNPATAVSIFKITIPIPVGYAMNSTLLQTEMDDKKNIYAIWHKDLYKYKPDGTLLVSTQSTNSLVQPQPSGSAYQNRKALFKYYRG